MWQQRRVSSLPQTITAAAAAAETALLGGVFSTRATITVRRRAANCAFQRTINMSRARLTRPTDRRRRRLRSDESTAALVCDGCICRHRFSDSRVAPRRPINDKRPDDAVFMTSPLPASDYVNTAAADSERVFRKHKCCDFNSRLRSFVNYSIYQQ